MLRLNFFLFLSCLFCYCFWHSKTNCDLKKKKTVFLSQTKRQYKQYVPVALFLQKRQITTEKKIVTGSRTFILWIITLMLQAKTLEIFFALRIQGWPWFDFRHQKKKQKSHKHS